MKFSKTLLICAATLLASCGDMKLPFPSKGNPVDDQKIIFLGQEITPDQNGDVNDQFKKLLSASFDEPGIQNGLTGLIFDAFNRGGFDQQIDLKVFGAQPGDARCADAKVAKIAFHTRNDDELPLTFGKMINFEIKQFNDPYWAGYIDVCTWIKRDNTYDEYFFHLDFNGDLGPTNTLQSHAKDDGAPIPFPGTLEPNADVNTAGIIAMMEQWDYKIHAKKQGVEVSAIWKNGQLLPRSDKAYINDRECFDLFLSASGYAELLATGDLPEQNSYCMGRCDALILNTK